MIRVAFINALSVVLVAAIAVDAQTKQSQPTEKSKPSKRRAAQKRDFSRLLNRFDKNKDGVLEGDEIPPQMRRRIKQFDLNNDGKVDKAELKKASERFGKRGGRSARRPGEVITGAAKGERYTDRLKVGDDAPDFTLADPTGKREVTLSSFQGKKPVVLIFGSYT